MLANTLPVTARRSPASSLSSCRRRRSIRSTSSCRTLCRQACSSSSSDRRRRGGGGGSGGGGGGFTRHVGGTANALTSTNLLYNGLEYVIQHPFVNDPLRPGKVDRVIAASFAFGTGQTFQSEVDALQELPPDRDRAQKRLPQVPQGGNRADRGRRRIRGTAGCRLRLEHDGGRIRRRQRRRRRTGTSLTGANNADNSSLGDTNGMSLPAVLDEVISVTGVYSFPYDQTPASPPTDRVNGVLPNPLGPILLLGNSLTIGGTASSSTGGTGSGQRRRRDHGRLQRQCLGARGGRLRDLCQPHCRRHQS